MSTPAPTSPVTPVTPPPDIPAVTPPPVTPVTPPPVTPVTPPPVTPVTPPPVTPVTPPPVIPVTPPPVIPTPTTPTPSPLPPTATPTPVSPLPLPPPRPTPTPTPVTPSQPPPRPTPTPTPATPSSPPPPRQTPTPTPVTPSPSPPRPTPTPTPATPSTPPPPSQTPPEAPASPPPPDDVPPSLSPPNGVPASPVPPPSPLSSWSPPPPPQSAGAPSTSASSSSPSSGTAVGVGVAVGAVVMLGLVAALIFFFVARRRRRRRLPPPGTPADFFYDPRQPVTPLQQSHAPSRTPSSTPPLMHSWQSSSGGPPGSPLPAMSGGTFAYDELAAAADWFSDANLLGQGGFGHVYKGTVRGQEVAIKKLRAGRGQGHREFRAEVDIISRVHHKNLVSLVGFCIHGEQRLLVYEYVPNKTLESHLHHGSGRPALDWPRRWKIAVGSAKGLAYLHEDCHPKIIHRDIKAANILLDYNYEPKVADFGLAKCQEAGHTTAGVSTRVMGTFGYLAPEYAATGKVNDRSDVFSFGVMLLELITGRKPIMTSSDHQPETLVSWGRPLLTRAVEEENYEELIDPRLETNYDAYDMTRLIACAAAAVRQTARSRPRMSQIVRYLEGELSAEDLNAGMAPGQSAMHRSSGGSATDEIRRLRKMAFGPGVGTGGTISEYASSELSEPTSEYGVNPSSEYTASSAADTGEMTDVEAQRTSGAGRSAAEGAGGTERLGRRATVSRQARRASRGSRD